MPTTRSAMIAAAALCVAAGMLTACSSSGSSGSTPNSTPPVSHSTASQRAAGSGTAVTATETEFHIALGSTSLKPGTVTFHVRNAGKITHALTVDGAGVDDKSTGDIAPGDSADLTLTLEAGKYDVYCPVGDHKMEGMDETVQVG